MRHTTITCLVALLALTLWGARAVADDTEYQEEFSRTEPLAADGKVYVMNISGDIRIKTWDRNEVRIEATKRSTAASAATARKNADMVTIDVRRETCCLKIETKYPVGRIVLKRFNVSVDYTLTVPTKATVVANTVSGDVSAAGMAGIAKLSSVSGSIRAEKMKNRCEFTTVSGDIEIKDIVGDVEVSDVSGDVSLCCLTGSIEAESVSGDVTAIRLSDAKSVEINVHSGEIVYEGTVNPDGRYTFETHSGPVTVTLPANAAFDFECESFSGHIESDFKAIFETSGKSHEHGPTSQAISGTVNGGGAEVTISTFSGSIELRRVSRTEK